MNAICQVFKISESLFEGNPLPDTVEDIIIFFTTENIGENNIPKHILGFLDFNRENPHSTYDEKIEKCQILWLYEEISFHTKRTKTDGKNICEKYLLAQTIDCFSNIFSLCIDNFDTFKKMGQRFHTVCREKIQEVLRSFSSGKITNEDEVYSNAIRLNNMSIINDIWV